VPDLSQASVRPDAGRSRELTDKDQQPFAIRQRPELWRRVAQQCPLQDSPPGDTVSGVSDVNGIVGRRGLSREPDITKGGYLTDR
jgi:hypothetical protein